MLKEYMSKKSRKAKLLFAGGFMSLKDIDKMPDGDAKNDFLQKIEIAKKNHNPSDNYGENGSRFPDEFLEQIGGMPVFYPLEWMADFIQADHKKSVDNNDEKVLSAMGQYVKSPDLYYVFSYMKPYYLGLCAYIILHTKDEKVFDSALEFLSLYRKYYVACLTNDKLDLSKQVSEHAVWLASLN